MQVTINGKSREFNEAAALSHILQQLDIVTGGVAVAINDAVVPRAQWDATSVSDGDRIEIIHAVQGG